MVFLRVSRPLVFAILTAVQFQTLKPVLGSPSPHMASQSSGSIQKNAQPHGGIEVLTDTEGVDFNSYLHGLYLAVRDKWQAGMPPAVKSGLQGKNSVQFRVLRDGKVPEDFLKLASSSENKDLDEASLQAVRKAAPFSHLPEKYSQSFIELRMTFYYNIPPQKPQ